MTRILYAVILLSLTLLLAPTKLMATTEPPASAATASATGAAPDSKVPKLRVGTKNAPPFSFQLPDGTWTGISIDLWRAIAENLNLEYEIHELELEKLIESTRKNEINIAVAAIGMTAQRNDIIEVSYPFFGTGLAMAVKSGESGGWWEFLNRLFSKSFLRSAGFLFAILLITGVLIWAAEHRRNPRQFGGSAAAGIGAGFWWSAVTMTTVGYGDKSPITPLGRSLALVWMFISLFALAGLTGAMASALTVTQLTPRIQGPADLSRVRVGALAGSTGAEYLRQNFILYSTFSNTADGLSAVKAGKIDTFVNDEPVLAYGVKKDGTGKLMILPQTFDPGFYAFGFPRHSPLRRDVNSSILQIMETSEWLGILSRYVDASKAHLETPPHK
jgi:polar amino acid transport system substrate-binding protein